MTGQGAAAAAWPVGSQVFGSTWLEGEAGEERVNFGGLVLADDGVIIKLVVPWRLGQTVEAMLPQTVAFETVEAEEGDTPVEVAVLSAAKGELFLTRPAGWTQVVKFPTTAARRPRLDEVTVRKLSKAGNRLAALDTSDSGGGTGAQELACRSGWRP